MIRFVSPEWWILVPLLLVVGFSWKRLRLWQPLRLGCLALLVLVFVQPQVRRLGQGLDLWVLVDRSPSAADGMAARLPEWEALLERSKGADDRLFYVDYSDVPVVRAEGTDDFSDTVHATRTRLAIQYALSQMGRDRAAHLLALTDGFSTEPLSGVAERLVHQGVSLDYRLVTLPDATDYGITDLRLPARSQPGEPFILELDVAGTPDGVVPFTVSRDGQPLRTGQVTVRSGRGRARLTDRVTAAGAHRYQVRLTPAVDARPGNNQAENWTEIAGGPRLLLVTNYPDDPAVGTLRAQGFEVQAVTDLSTLNAGSLSGTRAVILNNVPAYKLPPDFLAAMDVYVRVQGGGLLMAGGKQSFGSGGYSHSLVDDLLPVSMELRTEHRKLAVAMAIIMDRSGSMGAAVSPGITKMDLGDEGAARAIDLLGAQDAVAVAAVDTEPHMVVPLTRLGGDRSGLTDTVRRITSGGGGIYIGVGLRAGWEQLQKSDAGQRHLLLFSDAADSEQAADYKEVIDDMTAHGATVSVIGLGTDADVDAHLLEDIAARGNGRIFFNADANVLPGLFAQETVALARSAFLTEPVGVKPSAGWLELAAQPLPWPASLDGYNLSYLKPEATAAAYSTDEYAAPLVAFWQRGAGRAAAVSFPLGGEFSGRVRAWPQYGDFLQTLARWLMGSDVPPGLALRPRVNGSELGLDLFYDASWEERLAAAAPQVLVADGASGNARPLVWERLDPGHFHASTPLPPGRWLRGAVQVGAYTVPFGPVAAGTDPEWTLDRQRITELRNVAALSGGGECIDLSKIWQSPRHQEFTDARPWLLIALLVAFVTEALVTRMGWKWPMVAWPKRTVSPTAQTPLPQKVTSPGAIPASIPATPLAADSDTRAERFRQAKSRPKS